MDYRFIRIVVRNFRRLCDAGHPRLSDIFRFGTACDRFGRFVFFGDQSECFEFVSVLGRFFRFGFCFG